MAERDPETNLERSGKELEEQIGRLENHIREAEGKAAERRTDAEAPGDPAGGDDSPADDEA